MQKNVLIALAVIGTLTAGFFLLKSHKTEANTSELKNIYNQWKLNYKINVGAAEDNYRFGVFSSNYEKIQAHNSLLGRSYNKGLNAFTHLTSEEFAATHFGLKNVRLSTNTNKTVAKPADAADWRPKMNAVKDQGQCGSCWAFSTVGAIEGLHSVVKGHLYDLSEQELVDCSGSYGNQGCNGGLMDYGFQYAIDNKGLATEKAYPYTAADGDCQTVSQRFGAISSFTDVTANSKDALIAAIAQHPVSVAIEADTSTFQSYSDGVITDYNGCGTQLDHGVVAVGYNTKASGETPAYYIVRNSWGTSWGENGHVRLAIIDDSENSGAGMCGIQLAASYPSA